MRKNTLMSEKINKRTKPKSRSSVKRKLNKIERKSGGGKNG